MNQTSDLTTTAADVYARITAHIVAALKTHIETGQPWLTASAVPVNAASRKPYRGINVIALWVSAHAAGYQSPQWATFAQWRQLGTPVRKGEKATTVVFWKECGGGDEDETEDRTQRARFVARGYSVFNVAQTHAEETIEEAPAGKYAAAESFVGSLGADVRHGGDVAFYRPATDHVQMPHLSHYPNGVRYYSILAHELTHWTGAPSRLDRDLANRFGSAAYAMEELVAELGAAFLCATLGLEVVPRADHTHYIGSWLEVLGRDTRAVFAAASKAQAAVDWMCSRVAVPPLELA